MLGTSQSMTSRGFLALVHGLRTGPAGLFRLPENDQFVSKRATGRKLIALPVKRLASATTVSCWKPVA